MKGRVEQITSKEANEFLLPKHYSGRKPPISYAFGWYFGDELKAVCTFGKPPSPSLCDGICGKEHSHSVFELNRLCRVDDLNEPLSQFVSACLRRLRVNNWIIVSYSDMGMNHHGYIYQACNFVYTGLSKPRKSDWWNGDKHSRSCNGNNKDGIRQLRTRKHRYVYFATKDRRLKREWYDKLNYPIEPYSIVLDNESYDNSIIGMTFEGAAIYSYDRMVEEYMKDNACTEEEAVDWIEYNTMRAIPYMPNPKPIIVYEGVM